MDKDLLQYKRKSHVELGKIYFWTATILNWISLLSDDHYKDVIIGSLDYLSKKKIIDVFAFVVMPNHIHLIWRMNEDNGKESAHASFLKFTAHEFRKSLILRNSSLLSRFNPEYALENLFRSETTAKQTVTLTYLNSP